MKSKMAVLVSFTLCLTACACNSASSTQTCKEFDATTPVAMQVIQGDNDLGKKILQAAPGQPVKFIPAATYSVNEQDLHDVYAEFSPVQVCDDGVKVMYSINKEEGKILREME